jgi:hypothetical protein
MGGGGAVSPLSQRTTNFTKESFRTSRHRHGFWHTNSSPKTTNETARDNCFEAVSIFCCEAICRSDYHKVELQQQDDINWKTA